MQWIYHQEEHVWLKQKIMSQEETAINPQERQDEELVRQ
jgi:hypothetical protein